MEQSGRVDALRLIEEHYALQVFSSVAKSPEGQNFNANGSDTDSLVDNIGILRHCAGDVLFHLL